jgi:hypothetical protein
VRRDIVRHAAARRDRLLADDTGQLARRLRHSTAQLV